MRPQRRTLLVTPLLLAGAALSAPAQAWELPLGLPLQGSGQRVSQDRSVPSFTRLQADGPFEVTVRPGTARRVQVRADDNLQTLVDTHVENDTLVIAPTRQTGWYSREKIQVTVETPALAAASLRGSGRLSLERLQGGPFALALSGSGEIRLADARLTRLNVQLAGSGDIWLQGQADEARYELAGSGGVHADPLRARQLSVSVAGSGDAVVRAQDTLTVQIAGSGNVRYAGTPRVRQQVAGSGRVSASQEP